ncbi:multicopper oxidase domain-containing protein [Ferrigenium sp. UT5]|uniref:multicopper oxidase domain-containing protein n=1 Tax=Ferrigenium sp. UT5 TaxID=3242105 RepID=UPI0035532352
MRIKLVIATLFLAVLLPAQPAQQALAKEVKVTMTVLETELPVDNAGRQMRTAWTFGGTVPGKVVRVREGDTIDFTLVNPSSSSMSHSMDFHIAEVDVLNEFGSIAPGETKHFKFNARLPGVYMYHCGTMPMPQHIANGMYGAIIVDPKNSKNYPKADREYVLVQQQLFPDTSDTTALLENKGWTGSLINGKMFHYDPVHDGNATQVLEAKPGERVRIYFVNANINNPVAFHPIAGLWDRVYIGGNPNNTLYGIATYNVAVSEGSTFDLVTPAGRATNVAIVDHAMGAAMRGAITVLMSKPDADPNKGRGDQIILR